MLNLTKCFLPILCFIGSLKCTFAVTLGTPVGIQNYNYQISMQIKIEGILDWTHICGGSIIATKWVVTAAHCITALKDICEEFDYDIHECPITVRIVAGTTYLKHHDPDKTQAVLVVEAITHEDYDSVAGISPHDIGLLSLETELRYTTYVNYINLPKDDNLCCGDLTGYGLYSGPISPFLPLASDHLLHSFQCKDTASECKKKYDVFDENANICTTGSLGLPYSIFDIDLLRKFLKCNELPDGKTACNGDSGGPLAKNRQLYGVVSYGMTTCTLSKSVFVRVLNYVDWIKQETGL